MIKDKLIKLLGGYTHEELIHKGEMMHRIDKISAQNDKARLEHGFKVALSQLRDNCWCCKNGKGYEQGLAGTKLRTCEYLKEKGVIASNRGVNCGHWEWNHGKELADE